MNEKNYNLTKSEKMAVLSRSRRKTNGYKDNIQQGHWCIPPDEVAVRGLYQQLMAGWNKGTGAAYAAAFAEDGSSYRL